jgi:hypothetical protein
MVLIQKFIGRYLLYAFDITYAMKLMVTFATHELLHVVLIYIQCNGATHIIATKQSVIETDRQGMNTFLLIVFSFGNTLLQRLLVYNVRKSM